MPLTSNKHQNSPNIFTSKNTLKDAINNRLSRQPINQINKEEKDDDIASQKQEVAILQRIQIHESQINRGYFGYQNWINCNRQIFQDVQQSAFANFWKILRVINFGEVLIPTGLVFEILIFLIRKRNQREHQYKNLAQLINSFLKTNMLTYSIENFKQLVNYPSIKTIEDSYCLVKKQSKQLMPNKPAPNGQFFNRMFKDAKKRQTQLNAMRYASIVAEINNCKFSPSINQYKSNFGQKKCDRICHIKKQSQIAEQSNLSQILHPFKATQIDNGIFEGNLISIPGVQQHIRRKTYVQAEKNRIKRFKNRPFGTIR